MEPFRLALHLDSSNFYLLGHSRGGMLATEYALKYPSNRKGPIVSNMMASIPAYVDDAQSVLMPAMDPKVLGEITEIEAEEDYDNPRDMELLVPNCCALHILRMPPDQWPDPVNRAFARPNEDVDIPMQGPSEMSASGKLEKWDRSAELGKITLPTLTTGGRYDTMDPKYTEKMAGLFGKARYLYRSNGSHMAMQDDQKTCFDGLIKFVKAVDAH